MPKVLVIAYLFPPVGGGGVQRTTKFVRYLPDFGWEPIVLSVKDPAYATFDSSLLEDLPDNLVIERTNSFEPTALYFKFKRSGKISDDIEGSSSTSPRRQLFKTVLRKLINPVRVAGRWILERIFIPDDKIGWVPFALGAARRLIDVYQPDIIYTTSAPFSAHIIGSRLAKTTGLPWVADFRDPFVGSTLSGPQSRFHQWIRQRFEARWVNRATRVLTTAERTTDDFRERYPDYPASKWKTITNGYDEDDFQKLNLSVPDKFTLHYTGSLYYKGYPSPSLLLRAIRLFLDNNPAAQGQIRVVFTGRLDRIYTSYLQSGIQEYDLEGVIQIEEPVTHLEAIARMGNASGLLLILAATPGRELTLPGKVFEYLRTGRPVLAPLPPGATWDLLEGRENVYLSEPDDIERIASHLQLLFKKWQEDDLPTHQQVDIESFERQTLTKQLVEIFIKTISAT